MAHLVTTPNLADVDALYERLIEIHAGLSEAESLRVNARLILILMNHVGDGEALREAFALAAGAD